MLERKNLVSESYWLGYLAGIIDGEGCILLRKRKAKSGNVYYRPNIIIVMTHEETVNFLHKKFGGTKSKEKPPYARHKPRYRLGWDSASRVRKLLRKLNLITKAEQRELILEACRHIYRRGSRTRPLWQERKLDEIKQKIHELNRRGVHGEYDKSDKTGGENTQKLGFTCGLR